MKLCMMSSVMGFDTPEDAVDTAKYCQMEAIDWIFPADMETDPVYLHKLAVDSGLKTAAYTPIFSAFINDCADWREKFLREIEKASLLQAPVMMVPPFGSTAQQTLADDRKRWTDFYAWATPKAKEANICLTLEATGMLTSPITTADEALEVLDAVPDLRVTLDYGNMATAGETPEKIKLISGKIVHIHLKDWLISDTPAPGALLKRCGKYFANAMIGTGNLDVKSSWEALSPENKNCFVDLETADYTRKLSPREALKQVSDYLRNW